MEERALVEYAPYQKLPKLKKRQDSRMGTITEGIVLFYSKIVKNLYFFYFFPKILRKSVYRSRLCEVPRKVEGTAHHAS